MLMMKKTKATGSAVSSSPTLDANISDSTAAQRLADYLLRQADAAGSIRLPLTQRQLALHLGVRAETLSRLLADWVEQGMLAGARREWAIRNPEVLEALAQELGVRRRDAGSARGGE